MLNFSTLQAIFVTYADKATYAVVVMVISAVAFSFLQRRVVTRLARFAAKSKNNIDDAVVAMIQSVKPHFYWYLSFYLGLQTLPLSSFFSTVLNGLLLALVLWYAMRAASIAIDMQLSHSIVGAGEQSARHFISTLAKFSLWVIAILLLLSNLGINVTSLIAGLGIGGIAIAFALQNILTDLFSSFAIFFDKPFVVGDFIVVGDYVGTVERIGIKTTRLRALQGEELVVSNKDLTSTRIQNFHSMQSRRIQMQFGITYETPYDTVASLSEKVNERISSIKGIRVDRVHFAGFGDSSLDFILVYYVDSGDYTQYMDHQQELNLALLKLFAQENVEFAYPTRTVHVASAPTVKK